MAVVASTPTKELRKELEAAGEPLPDDDQLDELAQLFIDRLEALRGATGERNQGSMTWHNLFSAVDKDGSGLITLDELETAVRQKLKLKQNELPTIRIKALWCALDANDDNDLEAGEFRRFIARGELSRNDGPKFGGIGGTLMNDKDFSNEAIACKPTMDLRKELEESGVVLPADEVLLNLSVLFNERLEDSRKRSQTANLEKAQGDGSWFNLFCELDEDRSGNITLDELIYATRRKLKIKVSDVSDEMMNALWCVIDEDNSDTVKSDEFRRFLRLGEKEHAFKAKFGGQGGTSVSANIAGTLSAFTSGEAIAATPTKVMREELQAAGQALPDEEQLNAFAKLFHEGLDAFRIATGSKDQGPRAWFNLFSAIDESGDGVITFDELEDTARRKLKLRPPALSENAIKALWCALDVDDSDSIRPDEFRAFLSRHKAKKGKRAFGGRGTSRMDALYNITTADAIASTPTRILRAELEAAGEPLPNDEQLNEYAKLFYHGLELARQIGKKNANTDITWYALFKEVDKDGSGEVTFDEFQIVGRQKVGLSKSEVSANGMKALWCALDVDDSNSIRFDELTNFFKRYTPPKRTKAKFGGQAFHKGQAFGQFMRTGEALASQPTAEMRAELEAAGFALPSEEQLKVLCKTFNKRLEEARHRIGGTKVRDLSATKDALSWHQLFAEVDVDGSGFVTYDELADATRSKLRLSKSELPEDTLRALWCVLDADDSDAVQADEFKHFIMGQFDVLLDTSRARDKPPTGRLIRLPKLKIASTLPAARPAFDFDEYVRKATIEHEKRMVVLNARVKVKNEKRKLASKRQAKMTAYGKAADEQRRECITAMLKESLNSPIPVDNGGRLGGGRVVSLAQSERMLELNARKHDPFYVPAAYLPKQVSRTVQQELLNFNWEASSASAIGHSWQANAFSPRASRASSPRRTPRTAKPALTPRQLSVPSFDSVVSVDKATAPPSRSSVELAMNPELMAAMERLSDGLLNGVGRIFTPKESMNVQLRMAESLPELPMRPSRKHIEKFANL